MGTLRAEIEENGYVVIKGALPLENVNAVIEDIFAHLGASADDPATWYQNAHLDANGMVEMYHYQSLWDNRQYPPLHQIFSEIFGTEKLWVSLDRTNLKPPAHLDYPKFDQRGFIHWDTDIDQYPNIAFRVQGVVALTDTDESMGGFQCVPELYRDLDSWIANQRQLGKPLIRNPDITGYSITKVPLQAGDILIWSMLLPHGNGHNISSRLRLAQYISMNPVSGDGEYRQKRIESWEKGRPIPHPAFPGDPRHIEEQRLEPPVLTHLGRKLLGLDAWE